MSQPGSGLPNLLAGRASAPIRRWLVLWDDGRAVLPRCECFTSLFLAEKRAQRTPGARVREISWLGA